MRKSSLLVILAAVLASLVFVNVAAAADQQIIKVGKKGEILLDRVAKIGDITLKPGKYQVQHRVDGQDHFIQFVAFKSSHHPLTAWRGTPDIGGVKCSLETLPAKASYTRVTIDTTGGESRVIRIEIAGENVAHIF